MPLSERPVGRRTALGAAGLGISSLALPPASAAASTLGGSSDPSADISTDGTLVSTAGADVLSAGGITATAASGRAYRVFDAAGPFTFRLNGPLVVDVLLIGGGAGGCAFGASGGGAGAISMHKGVSLAAGDHTVTVGAGGLGELVNDAGENSAPEYGNGIEPASDGGASTFAVDGGATYTAAGGETGLRINGDPDPGGGWPGGTSPAGTSSGTGASASPGGTGGIGDDFMGNYNGGGGAGAGGDARMNPGSGWEIDGGLGFEIQDFFAASVTIAGGGGGGTAGSTGGSAADGGGAGGGVSGGTPVAGQAATAFGAGGGAGGKTGGIGAAGADGFRGLAIVRYAI